MSQLLLAAVCLLAAEEAKPADAASIVGKWKSVKVEGDIFVDGPPTIELTFLENGKGVWKITALIDGEPKVVTSNVDYKVIDGVLSMTTEDDHTEKAKVFLVGEQLLVDDDKPKVKAYFKRVRE